MTRTSGSGNTYTLTSYRLTRRVALTLCVLTLLFAGLADYFLYQSLVNKDRSLLQARLENYQRISQHAGLKKLIEVIDQEALDAQRWLVEIPAENYSNQLPYDEPEHLRLSEPLWPVINTAKKRWLIQTGDLFTPVASTPVTVTLGLGSLQRQQQQVNYRLAIISTLLPLLLFSLWLMHRIHRKTLSPLRSFLQTSARMQQDKSLSQRFQVNEPDSELGQLARQTNEFLDTIERLFNGMRHSLDNVAHDLRTPLARQRLRIEQLLMSAPVQQHPQLFDTLADISEESQRIETMLTTLMDISQAETGTLPLQLHTRPLQPLLQQASEIYSFVAEEKNISLLVHCPAEIQVCADETRLRQVLLNLLDNALKFSPEGSEVQIRACQEGDTIRLEICDQGSGIADQDLPHIFDRLYRADKSRNSPGLGLGLSLVKAVTEAHNGRIEVHPCHPGSCFRLILPAAGDGTGTSDPTGTSNPSAQEANPPNNHA